MDNLEEAFGDFKHLLDRGYKRTAALEFVGDHYRLDKLQRNILVRTVFSEDEINNHIRKLMPLDRIKGGRLLIDGYNVLIGVECALGRGKLIKSMDGFYRDSLGVFGKYKHNPYTEAAVAKILEILKRYNPAYTTILLDSQVSQSGKLASYIKQKMLETDIDGNVLLSRNVDYDVKRLNEITATSDSAIIERVDRVVDLISEVA